MLQSFSKQRAEDGHSLMGASWTTWGRARQREDAEGGRGEDEGPRMAEERETV